MYSPSRTSIEPLNASFINKLEDTDFGEDLKMRSNGSRRLAHAVPNPYSNSEFQLAKYSHDYNHLHEAVPFYHWQQ